MNGFCYFFVRGECKYDSRCGYYHPHFITPEMMAETEAYFERRHNRKNMVSQVSATNNELLYTNDQLRKQLDNANHCIDQLSGSQHALDDANHRIAQLSGLQYALDDANYKIAQLSGLQQELDGANHEIARLSGYQTALNEANTKIATLKKRLIKFEYLLHVEREAVKRLREERDKLSEIDAKRHCI